MFKTQSVNCIGEELHPQHQDKLSHAKKHHRAGMSCMLTFNILTVLLAPSSGPGTNPPPWPLSSCIPFSWVLLAVEGLAQMLKKKNADNGKENNLQQQHKP